MSGKVKAVLCPSFEHHAVIILPDGRAFQVSRQDVEDHDGGVFFLRKDAKIEHFFPKKVEEAQTTVIVPEEILNQLPI